MIDLTKCNKGDVLVTSCGEVLSYITLRDHIFHIVRYIESTYGSQYAEKVFATRDYDKYGRLRYSQLSEYDIVEIIK